RRRGRKRVRAAPQELGERREAGLSQAGNHPRPVGEARPHFFFMKKVKTFSSSACESSWLPVCLANAWKSFTAPGSVASTRSTCQLLRSASAFFARRIGSGQFRPRTSRSLSKFVVIATGSPRRARTIYHSSGRLKRGEAPRRPSTGASCRIRARYLNWDADSG